MREVFLHMPPISSKTVVWYHGIEEFRPSIIGICYNINWNCLITQGVPEVWIARAGFNQCVISPIVTTIPVRAT